MSLPLSPAGHAYGCIQNIPDRRDKVQRFTEGKKLPSSVDLSPWLGPLRDQTTEGSCVGHGWKGQGDWVFKKYGPHHLSLDLSPQFIYYLARQIEGTLPDDAGAQVRTGAQVFNRYGICPENDDLYGPQTMNTPPTDKALADALLYKGGAYHSLLTLYDMKCCLADENPYTFVDGIVVYPSFESDAVAQEGNVPMPDNEQPIGRHCTHTIGYDDNHVNTDGSLGAVKKRNSWGVWGEDGKGIFWLPYDYVNRYLTDATILHLGPAWVPKV